IHHVLVRVGQHLDLDVARMLEVFLEVHRGAGERRLRLGACHGDRVEQRRLGMHDAHSAPATAARGLDDHRIAYLARDAHDLLRILGSAPADPGTVGTPALVMACLALTLSPISLMFSGRGPMKTKPERSTFSAKSAFSERNPYPGWIASASVTSAALMIEGMFK